MKTRYLLGALAFTMSTAAFAADPAPAPEKECCCKKDEHGKMAGCKEPAGQTGGDHADHGEGGANHH